MLFYKEHSWVSHVGTASRQRLCFTQKNLKGHLDINIFSVNISFIELIIRYVPDLEVISYIKGGDDDGENNV